MLKQEFDMNSELPVEPWKGNIKAVLLSYSPDFSRDRLIVLREFCASQRDYIDAVWGMRQATPNPAPTSSKKAWPIKRQTAEGQTPVLKFPSRQERRSK